jgi:uncharacterized membrane protein YbjE (DUF340 family)
VRCNLDGLYPAGVTTLRGLEMVPAAIVHGFILSLLVPVLMAFFSA